MPATEPQCRVCGAAVAPQAWQPGSAPSPGAAPVGYRPPPGYSPSSGSAPAAGPPPYAPPAYGEQQPYAPPGYGPQAYGEPPKKRRVGLLIGLGVAIVVFGTCGAIGVLGAGIARDIGPARSAGQSIGNAVLAGDATGTWPQLHPAFQQKYGADQWDQLVEQMASPGARVAFNSVNVNKGTGGTVAQLTGPISSFKAPSARMDMQLRKESGRWLLLSIYIRT